MLELRPVARPGKPAGYFSTLRLVLMLVALVAAWWAVSFGAKAGLSMVLAAAIGLGFGLSLSAGRRVWMRQAQIVLDGTVVTFKQAWRTKSIETEGASVVRLTQVRSDRRVSDDVWLLVDRYRTVRLQLACREWGQAGLADLEERLSLPVTLIDTPMSLKEQRAMFPTSVRWSTAHSGLVLAAGVIIAAAFSVLLHR